MPKLIDYPRTTYAGAWELGEIVDDTGGKCAIDTAARKLNRKVSGSFKAIIGSAVKFGLLTSKRDLLTTTTLFKRIKHAYDKQEELLFHREAFLTPPLFTQLCRKFRSRELPVQMLDVMLIREFGVEEINAQGVAKAFVEGCRMVGLLDEHNIVADIDALAAQKPPRRELASVIPSANTFRNPTGANAATPEVFDQNDAALPTDSVNNLAFVPEPKASSQRPPASMPKPSGADAIANLFGLLDGPASVTVEQPRPSENAEPTAETRNNPSPPQPAPSFQQSPRNAEANVQAGYQLQMTGPGVNTILSITEEEDIAIAMALLEKIRRQLRA
jgi:hypothetical protein